MRGQGTKRGYGKRAGWGGEVPQPPGAGVVVVADSGPLTCRGGVRWGFTPAPPRPRVQTTAVTVLQGSDLVVNSHITAKGLHKHR